MVGVTCRGWRTRVFDVVPLHVIEERLAEQRNVREDKFYATV
jgi:hypothetical protein